MPCVHRCTSWQNKQTCGKIVCFGGRWEEGGKEGRRDKDRGDGNGDGDGKGKGKVKESRRGERLFWKWD